MADRQESGPVREAGRWPCVHGADCEGLGIDCGPDQSRRKPPPKSARELAGIRAQAWATRRAKYGERGHR